MNNNVRQTPADAPRSPTKIIVEQRGSGVGWVIGLALVLLVAIAAYFVIVENTNDQLRTDAIGSAAKQVGDSAERAGAAAERAVDPAK